MQGVFKSQFLPFLSVTKTSSSNYSLCLSNMRLQLGIRTNSYWNREDARCGFCEVFWSCLLQSHQPCWNGESTPQLSGWEAQGTKAMEETLQNPGKRLWKQVSLIQTLNVTFNSAKSDTVVFKNCMPSLKKGQNSKPTGINLEHF